MPFFFLFYTISYYMMCMKLLYGLFIVIYSFCTCSFLTILAYVCCPSFYFILVYNVMRCMWFNKFGNNLRVKKVLYSFEFTYRVIAFYSWIEYRALRLST